MVKLRTILRPRTSLFIVIALVLLGMFARQRISRLDGRVFFIASLPSAKGLIFYLLGDYGRSAKAYRDHYKWIYEKFAPAESDISALVRGDLKKARELAEIAIRNSRKAPHPILTLGEIALEEKSFDAAVEHFARVLAIEPDQYDALLLSSIAHARLRDYGAAIDAFNRALRYDRIHTRATTLIRLLEIIGDLQGLDPARRPLSLLAHYHRYLRIFDADQGDVAVSYANKAIEAGDHPDGAYLTLGIVYTKQWRTEKVLQAFHEAIRINPKNPEALRWASRIYRRRGDLVNEYRFMKAAYEAAPEDRFYFDALSEVMTDRLGDYAQALSLNLQWLAQHPPDARSLSQAGSIYYVLGDYRNALERHRAAAALDPRSYDAYYGMGASYQNLGDLEQAARAFQKAKTLRSGYGFTHLMLANVYLLQKRYREAIDEYEEGFKLGIRDPDRLKSLCWMYSEVSDFKRSVACYERVIEMQPNDVYARHQLSFALKNLRP